MAAEASRLLSQGWQMEEDLIALIAKQDWQGLFPDPATVAKCSRIADALLRAKSGEFDREPALRGVSAAKMEMAPRIDSSFTIINTPNGQAGPIREEPFRGREAALIVSNTFMEAGAKTALVITEKGQLLEAGLWHYNAEPPATGEILAHGGQIPSFLLPDKKAYLKLVVATAQNLFTA